MSTQENFYAGKERRLARIRGELHPLAPQKTFRPGAQVADGFTETKSDKRRMRHSTFVGRILSSQSNRVSKPAAAAATTTSSTASSRRSKTSSTPKPTNRSGSGALASTRRAAAKPSALISRPAGIKRRRPAKKLVTTLQSLADALPELDDDEEGFEDTDDDADARMEEDGEDAGGRRRAHAAKVKHVSLVSKRGALRRKERIVQGEMARFGASMAGLAAKGQQQGEGPSSSSNSSNGTTQTGAGASAGVKGDAPAPAPAGTANRWAALRGYISSTMEMNPAFK